MREFRSCACLTLRGGELHLLCSLAATSTATAPVASTLSLENVPVLRPRAVALGCGPGNGVVHLVPLGGGPGVGRAGSLTRQSHTGDCARRTASWVGSRGRRGAGPRRACLIVAVRLYNNLAPRCYLMVPMGSSIPQKTVRRVGDHAGPGSSAVNIVNGTYIVAVPRSGAVASRRGPAVSTMCSGGG